MGRAQGVTVGASFLGPSRPAEACLGVSLSAHWAVPRGGLSRVVQRDSGLYPSRCRIRDIMCAVALQRRAADPGLVRQTDSTKGASRAAASERKFQSHPTVPPGRLIELAFASAVRVGGLYFGTALGS